MVFPESHLPAGGQSHLLKPRFHAPPPAASSNVPSQPGPTHATAALHLALWEPVK